VENARGLDCYVAEWLVARDELVLDVPSTLTAGVRELSAAVATRPTGSTQSLQDLLWRFEAKDW
jgi:hypothetical protein